MKIVLALLLLLILVAAVCYAIGVRLPVDHVATITGTVAAPPARVFALITDVGNVASWRKSVKGVQLLPQNEGRDNWIEDLGHGNSMTFLATRTEPLTPDGHALREVLLEVKGASYGGTWTYKIAPAPDPGQTILQITETGFIRPPFYRFMMVHVFGMTHNLDRYLQDIQAAAAQPRA